MRGPVFGLTFTLSLVLPTFAPRVTAQQNELPSPFTIDSKAGAVVARGFDGKARWSTSLEGSLGGVRDPHLVWDKKRVYLTHNSGVTALVANSGARVWYSDGPIDRLFLSGELLLAADYISDSYVGKRGRLLTARSVTDGKEVFRVQLPVKDFDPDPIVEMAGLFLVQTSESPRGEGNALLIDREGKVRHRVKRQVVAGFVRGDDVVLLTSSDVVCLTPAGKEHWMAKFPRHQWIAGGGFVRLAGDEVLAFRFGMILDSGVDVLRINLKDGKGAWQTHCEALGVAHSKYKHQAKVEVQRGDTVQVTSEASGGTFVEVLDLGTGKHRSRK